MARVNYSGIVTELVGSISGTVFQKNGSGFICRSVGHCRKSTTPLQKFQHQKHYSVLRDYTLLSLDDKLLWRDFASLHSRVDKFGNTRLISGANWFQSINSNLLLLGESGISSPPIYILPVSVPDMNVVVKSDGIYWNITGAVGNTDDFCELYLTPALIAGTSKLYRFMRSVYVVQVSDPAVLAFSWLQLSALGIVYNPDFFRDNTSIGWAARTVNKNSGIASPLLTGLATFNL